MKKNRILLLGALLLAWVAASAQNDPVALMNQGVEALKNKQYDVARPLFEQAMKASREGSRAWQLAVTFLGDAYSGEALDLGVLSIDNQRIADLSHQAQPYFRQAGRIDRALREMAREAQALANLGQAAKGKALLAQGLAECKADTALAYARSQLLYTLGVIEQDEQDYQSALSHLEESFMLKKSGGHHRDAAAVAAKMNSIYTYEIADRDKANFWLAQREQEQRLAEQLEPHAKVDRASWMNHVPPYKEATLKIVRERDYEGGVALITTLIDKASANAQYPKEHLASYLKLRAHGLTRQKRYDEAATDYQKAIGLLEEAGEAGRGDLSAMWYALAITYYNQGGHQRQTLAAADKAIETALDVYGPLHTTTLDAYSLRANFNGFFSRSRNALGDMGHCFDIIQQNIERNFAYLTAQERAAYWEKHRQTTTVMFAFAHKLGDWQSAFTDKLYDQQLLSKGLLLTAESALQRAIDADPSLGAAYQRIRALRLKAADDHTAPDEALSATLQAEQLERQLGETANGVHSYLSFLGIHTQDVRKRLGARDAAIEFVDYRVGKDSLMYAAIVVTPRWKHARLIPLFEVRQLETADRSRMFQTAELAELVWRPILDAVGSTASTLYFAPTGQLHQLAIESLPLADGRLVGEAYHACRLSSTRWLASERPTRANRQATLYGGVDYTGYGSTGVAAFTRGAKATIAPLPYTLNEVNDIGKTIKADFRVMLLTAHDATKQSLAPVGPGAAGAPLLHPRILHRRRPASARHHAPVARHDG